MPHPDKRAALSLLTVKRLGGLCDAFELDRAAGARKDDLVELLARSKRAAFEAILGQLKRDELKDICRAHNLDDSGKEKEPIIARILGRASSTAPQPELPGLPDAAEAAAPAKPGPTRQPRAKKNGNGDLPGAAYEVRLYVNGAEVAVGGFGVKGRGGLDNDDQGQGNDND